MAFSILGSVAAAAFSKVCERGTHHYYKVSVPEGDPVYKVLLNILHEFRDCKFTHWTCYVGEEDPRQIAADMLCFRNQAGYWDMSDFARMKVRIQYDQYNCVCVVMCKKKYQLEAYLNQFRSEDFKPNNLVAVG